MASNEDTPISPVGTKAPELTLSIASINNEPVELDSTPASPETLRLARRGSKATALEALEADASLSAAEKERRAQAILSRQSDPAVLVDIPQTPQAEELEKAGATDDIVESATSSKDHSHFAATENGRTFEMYIDARPMSTFQHYSGWNMPQNDNLKQPPAGNNGQAYSTSRSGPGRPPLSHSASSTSSLSSNEPNVPSFQTFLRQTPPLEHDPEKPLPPTPLRPSRSNEASDEPTGRRSSSVYSQTPSQWASESNRSWRTEDLEDDFPLAHHRPIAYSISTPDLVSRTSGPLLEPRVFSPLIATPSPTLSASIVLSSPPHSRRATALLPPSILPRAGPKKKIQTVSLEKAIQARDAPGAVRLLPEELRAQTVTKGHVRVNTLDIFNPGLTPQTATFTIATPVDNQGRQRLLSTPLTTPPANTSFNHQEFPFPSLGNTPYENAFHVGTMPVRAMAPPIPVERRVSKADAQHDDGERGRRMERGRRSRGFPPKARKSSSVGAYHFPEENDQRDLVDEYTTMLAQQYRPSGSPAYDSDESIRTHMKMVPQPLFMGKQPARKSGTLRGSGMSSKSTTHRRTKSEESTRSGSFPLRISPKPPLSYNRGSEGSTTGMIPISPPTDLGQSSPQALNAATFTPPPILPPPPSQNKKQKADRKNSRESQFYPHVMRRASSKRNPAKDSINENAISTQLPGLKLLPPEVVAQQLKTPIKTPDTTPLSPLGSNPPVSNHKKSPSDGSSEKNKKTLYERMKGVTRHARRSSESRGISPSSKTPTSTTSSRPSPTSPHLYPSPVKSHEIHLGWSDTTKQDFDDARSPPPTPKVTHVVLPARPLDGRSAGLADDGDVRRPSLFGTFQARWTENKAEKRRHNLRKLITVVPNVGVGSTTTIEESGGEGDDGRRESLVKRLSGYKWM